MNLQPNRIEMSFEWLREQLNGECKQMDKDGGMRPARYVGWQSSVFRRFETAWHVFTGRADALYWEKVSPTGELANKKHKLGFCLYKDK